MRRCDLLILVPYFCTILCNDSTGVCSQGEVGDDVVGVASFAHWRAGAANSFSFLTARVLPDHILLNFQAGAEAELINGVAINVKKVCHLCALPAAHPAVMLASSF